MALPPEDEKELRLRLAETLGVEFYEPDDPEVNLDVSTMSSGPGKTIPGKVNLEEQRGKLLGQVRQVSVSELIQQCNDAIGKMGVENPHRRLLWNCAFALRQLVERLEKVS